MVVAVAKAHRGGRPRDHLRLDRQHVGVGGRLRRRGRARGRRRPAARAGSPPASCSRRRPRAPGSSPSRAASTTRCASSASSPTTPDPDHPVTLVNSVNPYRLEGQKTAAFEVCEDLGGAPDYLAIPVGNAGNISAYWHGLHGVPRRGPRRDGAARCSASRPRAPRRSCWAIASDDPQTVATAIRIGRPGQRRAWRSRRATSRAAASTRSPTTRSSRPTATWPAYEGIFCEPASAASVAGVRKLAAEGRIDPGATIVACSPGHGLKDPDTGAHAGGARRSRREPERRGRAQRAGLVSGAVPTRRDARRAAGHGRRARHDRQPRRRASTPWRWRSTSPTPSASRPSSRRRGPGSACDVDGRGRRPAARPARRTAS